MQSKFGEGDIAEFENLELIGTLDLIQEEELMGKFTKLITGNRKNG